MDMDRHWPYRPLPYAILSAYRIGQAHSVGLLVQLLCEWYVVHNLALAQYVDTCIYTHVCIKAMVIKYPVSQTIFCRNSMQAGSIFWYYFHEYHQTTRPQNHSRLLFRSLYIQDVAVSLLHSCHIH